jgi:hypothetical protein
MDNTTILGLDVLWARPFGTHDEKALNCPCLYLLRWYRQIEDFDLPAPQSATHPAQQFSHPRHLVSAAYLLAQSKGTLLHTPTRPMPPKPVSLHDHGHTAVLDWWDIARHSQSGRNGSQINPYKGCHYSCRISDCKLQTSRCCSLAISWIVRR